MRLSSQSNKFKSMVQSIEFIDHGGIILSSRSGIVASVIIVIIVFSAVGGYVFLTNQYVPSNVAVVVVNPGFGDRSMADQALSYQCGSRSYRLAEHHGKHRTKSKP